MNINEIENPKFLKQLNIDELNTLSQDIRTFLIQNVSKTGGHFSSNLGIVELTIALHYVFNSPVDKILFDVGHQCYVHKILTGRAAYFDTLRQFEGLSGFQRSYESEYDCWEAGHSSTALSGASGMAIARDLNHEKYSVISVVGDGAMMSGESFEALNFLGSSNTKVIIIFNDNNMSISKNVGGFSNVLSDIRVSHKYNEAKTKYSQIMNKTKAGQKLFQITKNAKDALRNTVMVDSMFKQFGLDYIGPIDGHNMKELINTLQTAKNLDHSVVVHVRTIKGKGYALAEKDKIGLYHGVQPFDYHTGIVKNLHSESYSWSQCISSHIEYLMSKNEDIVAITPAMISGSCLNDIFLKYPERSFDVGIAEEHALTFAAGLSKGGKFPFVSIYSSFLQRAYDQLNHDLSRMSCPSLVGVDRADLVGGDGSTHHGVFDISILKSIPGIIIMAPSNGLEAQMMINTAYMKHDKPYVMRYSKNSIKKVESHTLYTLEIGSWTYQYDVNHTITVITYGDYVNKINRTDINIINARFIKPIDEKVLEMIKDTHIIVYENVMKIGSLGESISAYYHAHHIDVNMDFISIEDHYVRHGDNLSLQKEEEISLENLYKVIEGIQSEERTC